jgi:hypothetical protein
MTHARFLRSIGPLVLVIAGAGAWPVACSSSNGGAPDGGVFDGSEMDAAGFDAPIIGPLDAFALDEAGASSTCKALSAYAKCNTSDPCADLAAKDCIYFDGVYNDTGRKAFTSCYGSGSACDPDAGTDVTDCIFEAALAATPDTAQKKLATDFCAVCSSGSTCAADFFNDIANDAGNVGAGATLELALVNDATIEMIDSMCVTGLKGGVNDCGFTFASCVGPILDPGQCSTMSSSGGDGGSDADADPGGA